MGGRETVERLIATINAGDVDGMDDLFTEDVVMDWPQSGERVVGADNRRAIYHAFPSLPAITPRRIVGEGDLWVAEATLDYGGGAVYRTVFVFEMRGDRIARETAYWSEPFEAPAWRAQWVERVEPAGAP